MLTCPARVYPPGIARARRSGRIGEGDRAADLSHLAASVVDMANRPSPSSRAEQFRKRADAIGKRLKKTANKKEQAPLRKKQRALNDMADNEDWLAGKTKR